jgi:hypothetical protein
LPAVRGIREYVERHHQQELTPRQSWRRFSHALDLSSQQGARSSLVQ